MNSFGDIHLNLEEDDLEDIFQERNNYTDLENDFIKNMVTDLTKSTYISRKDYTKKMNSVLKNYKGKIHKFPSKIELNIMYRRLKKSNLVEPNRSLEKFMKRKFCRSGSGELPVTVFTSPSRFDCPEDCNYCPDEKEEQEFTNPKTGRKYKKRVRIQPILS